MLSCAAMKYLLLFLLWLSILAILGHCRPAERDIEPIVRPTPNGYEQFRDFVTIGPRNPLAAPKPSGRWSK